MKMESPLIYEKVWFNKYKYDDAERQYFENLAKITLAPQTVTDGLCVSRDYFVVKVESPLIYEKVWFNKYKYDDAERQYFENLAKLLVNNGTSSFIKNTKLIPSGGPVSQPSPQQTQGKKSTTLAPLSTVDQNDASRKQSTVIIITDKEIQCKIKDRKRSHKDKKEKAHKLVTNENKENLKLANTTNINNKEISNKVSSNIPITNTKNTLAEEVAKARQHIQSSLECMDGIAAIASAGSSIEVNKRITALEKQNKALQDEVAGLKSLLQRLTDQVGVLEKKYAAGTPQPQVSAPAKKEEKKKVDDDDDDGVDLFGSDSEEEDEAAKKVREQRLAEYANRKSKKPTLIAKSNIILDVKPWDDETDMQKMEAAVRKVAADGLVWGASKLVPLAYGIHKLQISCVVEDDKISVDWLQETIQEIEDYVQSVDIAAFNKV